MYSSDEAGLQIVNLGQARKEGVVAIRVVPHHVVEQPLYEDALANFSVAAHGAHEVAGHPKYVEVVH